MESKKIVKNVNTKMFADGDAFATNLTIDFTGLSNEDIMEVAAQAAVVKWQSNARRMKEIPSSATYVVPKPGTRSSAPITPDALVARFGSIDAAIEALKKLQK